MNFAKIVFWIGGAVGIPSAVYMYLQAGDFRYYATVAGLVAWQPAFFLIGSDPKRFRPMMIPAVLEKWIWVATFVFLYLRGSISATDVAMGIPFSLILGALYLAAFFQTRPAQ